MNSEEIRIREKARVRVALHKTLVRHAVISCCFNCDWWDSQEKQCAKYGAVPPPDIITYGCPEWENEIPA